MTECLDLALKAKHNMDRTSQNQIVMTYKK
jgi:hypothetical protein